MTDIKNLTKSELEFYRTGIDGWISQIQDDGDDAESIDANIMEEQLIDVSQLCSQVVRVHELAERFERDAEKLSAGIVFKSIAAEIRLSLGNVG